MNRLVGVTFLISFVSLSTQVLPAAGARGIFPVAQFFPRIVSDFPTLRRFLYFPTLLWLRQSDAMLRALVGLGVAGALGVIYGGPCSFLGMVACYLAYLSLDMPMGLIFPWDCVLFETAFLGMLLGPTLPLPQLAAVHPPEPIVAWAYRLLLFRVMFGFGKFKFLGSTAQDRGYLKGFLINQPLTSYVGWYLQKLPIALLKVALSFMFLTEVPIPFLLFIPGTPSLLAGAAIALLMVGIQLCGSFGYFSFAMLVLCVSLLDNQTPRMLALHSLFSSRAAAVATLLIGVHTFLALLAVPFNSWVSQRWFLWTLWERVRPKWLSLPLVIYRALYPFRCVHSYGVFFPGTSPAIKCVPVMELSWDGANWVECPFKYAASQASSAPKFVSPHHHRVDQALIYDVFGANGSTPAWGVTGSFSPYFYQPYSGARTGMQRILEGFPYLGYIFDEAAIGSHDGPPIAARTSIHLLQPTSLSELRHTKQYWKRSYLGPHVPPVRRVDGFWERALPVPELWHWDEVLWRRRSKLNVLLERAVLGDPLREVVRIGAPELKPSDVEAFFAEFLALASAGEPQQHDWQRLPDVVLTVRARYDQKQLYTFERILGRLTCMLVAKLEPLFMRKPGATRLALPTHYHLSLLAQGVILEGEAAVTALYENPELALPRAAQVGYAVGYYLTAIFQYEALIFQAQKRRLTNRFLFPQRASGVTRHDQKALQALDLITGAMGLLTFLEGQFRGPRFEQGFPECYPTFVHLANCEVHIQPHADELHRNPCR